MIRHCSDCKHSVRDGFNAFGVRCIHPQVAAQDVDWVVTKHRADAPCCVYERSKRFFAACGRRGKLWEPTP